MPNRRLRGEPPNLMFRVEKTFGHDLGFSCAFRQWRAASHCRFIHGYALSFTLAVEAEELDACHWAFDFGGFNSAREFLKRTFDHKLLLASDDPALHSLLANFRATESAEVLVLPNVGCEAFAEHVHTRLNSEIIASSKGRACLVSVTVKEHGANSVTFYPKR